MGFTLPLEKMSNSDKIAVMEEIWDDLRKDPDSVPSPEWRSEALRERIKCTRRKSRIS